MDKSMEGLNEFKYNMLKITFFDYAKAKYVLMYGKDEKKIKRAQKMIYDVESFIFGDWYPCLSDIPAERCYQLLKQFSKKYIKERMSRAGARKMNKTSNVRKENKNAA